LGGSFGGLKTPCEILVCDLQDGSYAYAVEGSQNVNLTWEPLENGVWLEQVEDYDYFHANNPIWEIHDLLEELEEVGL
jgi:hypothetical protein